MIIFRKSFPTINYIPHRFVENLPRNVRLELDSNVNKQLKSDNQKLAFFKEHQGKFHQKNELTKKLEETINTILSDIEPQRLKIDMKLLADHLVERRLPIEQRELQAIAQNVIQNLINTQSVNTLAMSPEERERINLVRQRELIKRLKSSIYHWQPLNFDEYKSKIYLATNFASHYAMLSQIFNEIKKRVANFRPTRLFDFGSGSGSVMWAAMHIWGKQTFAEILNVDKSREMNNLSQLILQDGQSNKPPIIPGIIYRQFLPHGRENTFDLVVADHALFELENRFERLKMVQSLWYNVKPGGFLILVERGTIHGYSAINEARENLLYRIASVDKPKTENDDEILEESNDSLLNQHHSSAHIFSPCPHDAICPKKKLNIPCRISTRYRPLQIFDIQQNIPDYTTVQMSYIVVKKSERDKNDIYGTWPRVIEPILDRKHHQHVRLCCPNGEYVSVPISKNKHGAYVIFFSSSDI
jgi:ribosomal protein RSM22 (predicted rRNA methylase)